MASKSGKDALKVLLVDDQKSIRDLARVALEEAGVKDVTEATNGEQALEIVRANEFDLVISDWNMQPMDGLEFLIAIRGDAALKKTPFILMTGQPDDEQFQVAGRAGVDRLVAKPFNSETVKEAIAQVVGGL